MRILFAGTPETAVPSLHALLASEHDVVAVLTRPDAPAGRRGRPTASPVARAAADAGLPVHRPRSVRTPEFAEQLAVWSPDAVAVVAYGALIPAPLLAVPRHGWINLHFSLLPAWRGAAPVQAALRAGDEITGATTFRIDKDLDTGPVFGTVTERIRPTDTAGELLGRLADSGAALLVATMDGLASGTLHPKPQPADGISHAAKISTADARIDLATPALAVDRHIRSVTPHPGAWVESRWGRLRLGPVQLLTEPSGAGHSDEPVPGGRPPADLPPGELWVGKQQVLVGTATGPIRLGTVQAPGKRPMAAADWARGARPDPGERIGAGWEQP